MTFKKITENILNDFADALRIELRRYNSTGEAINSLEVKGNELLGAEHIYYLVHGRGPGKFPPVNNIRDWVRNKLGVEDAEVNSIAYLIGKKISEEGTEIYKDKSKGIDIDYMIELMEQKIREAIAKEMAMMDVDKIDDFVKTNLSTFGA